MEFECDVSRNGNQSRLGTLVSMRIILDHQAEHEGTSLPGLVPSGPTLCPIPI